MKKSDHPNMFMRACSRVWQGICGGAGWVARVWTGLRLWLRIVIAAAAALVVAVVVALMIMLRTPSDRTVMSISIDNTPMPTQLSDSTSVSVVDGEDNDDSAPVTVAIPTPNNDRELSPTVPLSIGYNLRSGRYSPMFRMGITTADLERGVRISPTVKGKWVLDGESSATFTPTADWSASTKFTINFDRNLFNDEVRMTDRSVSFSTPDFAGNIDSFAVYPNLAKNKTAIAVAVLSYNYPIDTKTFADKVSMTLSGRDIGFTIKYDIFNRTAFITTDAIPIGADAQKLKLNIGRVTTTQGDARAASIDGGVTVEAEDNFFKIADISAVVADNKQQQPEQLLLLNMTSNASNVKWDDYIRAYLLPQHKDSDEDANDSHEWAQDEITDDVLARATRLDLKKIEFANPGGVYQYAFSFDVNEPKARYIFVSIKPGVMSDIGFPLKSGADKILSVPYPDKQVKIAGTGAILSMAGGQRLTIMSRGGADAAYLNLSKVKSSEINHLISQTYNIWGDIDFRGYSFGTDDMSVVFKKKIGFADHSLKRTNYASVDLGEYLNKTSDRTGIFIVQVAASESDANDSDKRLILLTDLGIIRKINADNSSSVFVASLAGGAPVGGANVSVLGRNGSPVWTGETDAGGRANLPNLPSNEYRRDREPVAIVVSNGNDVSFIPFEASGDQRVEYSKFDIEGEYDYATRKNPITAYLFSDRGIYRPGEQFIIGGIAKDKAYQSLSGVPVKLEIRDSRDRVLTDKTFSLSSDGMFDFDYKLSSAAPVGEYRAVLLSLNDKGNAKDTLGNATFRVEEFVPDTLKINVTIANAKPKGWIRPTDMSAHVSLFNMFGTPATDRRISSRATLTPAQFSFADFAGYRFTSNMIAGTGLSKKSTAAAQTQQQDMPNVKTDENGAANIDIKFDNAINPGTYVLSFSADGFEGDSGRSVSAGAATKVSDAEYLVGYKPSDDLSYVKKDAKRSISVIAINDNAEKTEVSKLTLRVVMKQNLVALVKDYNGYYKYQTTQREKLIRTKDVAIPSSGKTIDIDTQTPGDYYIQIADASDRILMRADYFVAGATNASMDTDQQPELKMKLSAAEYAPGENMEINITAPYAGSGLITIERDKVYAYKWFRADATSSVQNIRLPDDFEGNGYVNVSFVRDINSRDVFTVPYAYAVAPFSVDKSKRTIKIDLSASEIVRDKKLTVNYSVDKSSKIMIFAVNEGILQVAKFKNPNPLAFFFQKSALQVKTYQILSLLLPEYDILREFAKTGGDGYAAEMAMDMVNAKSILNPFARALDAPVAFYSGILDATAGKKDSVTFDIPDQFNGEMRIFAVAANDRATGSAAAASKIQSPIVISQSAPFMAVPGDEFTVNVVVSNMTEESGANAKMNVAATVSDNLEIIGEAGTMIQIPQGTEKMWKFNIRARDGLGNAEIKITANVSNGSGKVLATNSSKSTLSIRPATTFMTNITGGFEPGGNATAKDFKIDTYPEFAVGTLLASDTAFVLVKPLYEYLKKYEYGCSEQLVSKTLPYALFPQNDFLGTDAKSSAERVNAAIGTLRNRQNDNGSFSLWDVGPMARGDAEDAAESAYDTDADTAYVTALVVQFLTLAKDNGFNVPSNMLTRGVGYLRTYAGENIGDDIDAATHAFAIYLISRNGFVTTAYIDTFHEYADENMKGWESTITGAYIAASYKMLKQDSKARDIISKYKPSGTREFVWVGDFNNNVVNDANFLYLANRYFPDTVSNSDRKKILDTLSAYIASGYYSSFTSAAAILALAGFKTDAGTVGNAISATATVGKDMRDLTPVTPTADVFAADIPANTTRVDVKCASCGGGNGLFWAIIQQGFPRKPNAANNGIEITREFYNAKGDRIDRATVGDTVLVKISLRATGKTDTVSHVVVTDLLPAGFAADTDSVNGSVDFSEVREDRVLAFLTVSREVTTIKYTAKPTASGTFTVPGISASAMYNPRISGAAAAGKFTVENAKME